MARKRGTSKSEPKWEERRKVDEPRQDDHRSAYERDIARTIHSGSFRRLQGKTQVLGIGEGDFHRTRLTHSMEAFQIGRGLVGQLERQVSKKRPRGLPEHALDADVVSAAALAHDLGHPPFGHKGEIALNYCMRNWGGFEGNGHTLRLISRLEKHTESYGTNPTRRTLLAVLKYPTPYSKVNTAPPKRTPPNPMENWKPPKCYLDTEQEVVEWLLHPFSAHDKKKFQSFEKQGAGKHRKSMHHSLDTSILELADDIAYGVHDLEDAVHLGLISKDHITEKIGPMLDKKWARNLKISNFVEEVFSKDHTASKRAMGDVVNAMIVGVRLESLGKFDEKMFDFNAVLPDEQQELLGELKKLVRERVIQRPEVQTLEYRGQHLVQQLFRAFHDEPERLLGGAFLTTYNDAPNAASKARVVCDYIAGMTDQYAARVYERLFVPGRGTVFERL